MNVSIAELVLAAAAGVGLGIWFFGGLLWTVRRLPDARSPVALAFGSFLVRAAGVAAAMVWLMGRHWTLPLVAVAGLLAVRIWMVRVIVPFSPLRTGRKRVSEDGPWT